MSTIKLCNITALFGFFLETHKHQNIKRLRWPIYTSMRCHKYLYDGKRNRKTERAGEGIESICAMRGASDLLENSTEQAIHKQEEPMRENKEPPRADHMSLLLFQPSLLAGQQKPRRVAMDGK